MPWCDVHQSSISGNIKLLLRARALYHVLDSGFEGMIGYIHCFVIGARYGF